ncbi:MAG: alcohol dehydrogenase catalytic domain-containing protein [Vicinamibacteria bacterium]
MKSLWLEERTLSLRDIDRPTPVSGEALVRVRLAGICATDLELVKGYYPYSGVPGHEFVGEIVAAPDAPERVGERVVGEINAVCGNCGTCHRGHPRHCERRTVLGIVNRNGAFAEFLTLPLANLLAVPAHVPDEAAVFTEPLAAALEIRSQVAIGPGDRVLVIGAGRLGQLIARSLLPSGARIEALVRHARQRERLHAAEVAAISEEELPSRAVDVVIEATGSHSGFALAQRAVRPRGVIVLKSTYAGRLEIDAAPIVVDEITIVGSRCGEFAPALEMLSAGTIDPRDLIDGERPLRDGLAAFEQAGQPGALKILLQP